MDSTQEKLATGKSVNSAMDDALSFFTSRSLNNRASDLDTIKSNIQEGVNQIETAVETLESGEDLLKQMKAVAASAKSTAADDSASRVTLGEQFNTLRSQLDHMMDDASYNGINLLKDGADTLTVVFSEADDDRALEVDGITSNATSLGVASAGVTGGTTEDWGHTGSFVGTINDMMKDIDSALTTVRTTAQTFGTNASMLQIRETFTEDMMNTLEGGASQLVNADMNEESANMLTLQTRQQLGTISLSMANQSQQSVMRLF